MPAYYVVLERRAYAGLVVDAPDEEAAEERALEHDEELLDWHPEPVTIDLVQEDS